MSATDFLVWECHCYLLERRSTVYVVEVDASSQGIQILYRKWMCTATWYVWQNDKTNKLCKILYDWTTNKLQQHIISILPQFLQHGYTKRTSSTITNKNGKLQKATLTMNHPHDTSQTLIQVDFSEKYTCVAQDKIQGVHWNLEATLG